MIKRVFGKKLSRERTSREALFVSLVVSLVEKGKIVTTKAKAKAIVGMIDRLVVLAKKGTLSSKRQILKKLRNNKKISSRLWNEIAETFKTRRSGFTRIIPLFKRKGDMADIVSLEWTDPIKVKEVRKNVVKEDKKDETKKNIKTVKPKIVKTKKSKKL